MLFVAVGAAATPVGTQLYFCSPDAMPDVPNCLNLRLRKEIDLTVYGFFNQSAQPFVQTLKFVDTPTPFNAPVYTDEALTSGVIIREEEEMKSVSEVIIMLGAAGQDALWFDMAGLVDTDSGCSNAQTFLKQHNLVFPYYTRDATLHYRCRK